MDADLLAADEARRFPHMARRRLTGDDVRSGTGCRHDPIWLHWAGQVACWHTWFAWEASQR